jgi:hypothetical protein
MRPIQFRESALGFGLVQGHGGADGAFNDFVYLLALAKIDRTPGVPSRLG